MMTGQTRILAGQIMNTIIFFLPYMEYQITLAIDPCTVQYCIDVQVFRGKLVKFIHKLLSSSPGFSPPFMSVYIYFDFEYHRTAVSQVSFGSYIEQHFIAKAS